MKYPKTVEDGYRKLAFGGIGSAVRLLFLRDEESLPNFDKLDLYCVQEIHRGKDGILEIKFYDRLRAMECLEAYQNHSEGEPLQEALSACAKALNHDHDSAV